jgi:hypothetical protein
MSRSDTIERKKRELSELKRDMGGINPKLSIYK